MKSSSHSIGTVNGGRYTSPSTSLRIVITWSHTELLPLLSVALKCRVSVVGAQSPGVTYVSVKVTVGTPQLSVAVGRPVHAGDAGLFRIQFRSSQTRSKQIWPSCAPAYGLNVVVVVTSQLTGLVVVVVTHVPIRPLFCERTYTV